MGETRVRQHESEAVMADMADMADMAGQKQQAGDDEGQGRNKGVCVCMVCVSPQG